MRFTRSRSIALQAAVFGLLHSHAPHTLHAPDAEQPAGGGGAGTATDPEHLADDDGPPLVVDTTPTTPPTPAAPAPEAIAAPVTPPAAAAPAASPMDPMVQRLQQDVGTLMRKLDDLGTRFQTPAPAAPAAPAVTAPVTLSETELEKMLADTYEVDVERDPKLLARELIATRKALKEQLDQLRTETVQDRQRRQTEDSQRVQLEAQRAFAALQEKHPQTNLNDLWKECHAAAQAAGYGQLGEAALRHRAGEIWEQRLQALGTPAPNPTSSAAPAPASPPATPAGPRPAAPHVSPGGAQVRAPAAGGNPQPSATSLTSYDDIESRHTLVRQT